MLRLIRPLRTAAAVTVARSAPPLLSHRKPAVIAAAAATGLFAALIELTSSPASAWCEQAAGPYLTANFIADAAAKASPALVHIRVSGSYRQASGSGFVVDPSGIVLTNTHVIGDALSTSRFGGGTVSVTLSDGITELPGVVQHADPISDIAIVKVQSPRPLPAVRLGSSAALRVGEFVVALGSPAGLTNSVSAGIVSSVERTRSDLGLDRRNRAGNARAMHYIQTDAAINQGNSGGPLLNLAGEVIGVNTMKVSGADGIAFAVPIDEVKRVVSQLQRHGKVLQGSPVISHDLPRSPISSSGTGRCSKDRHPVASSSPPHRRLVASSWPPHRLLIAAWWPPDGPLIASSSPPDGLLVAFSSPLDGRLMAV